MAMNSEIFLHIWLRLINLKVQGSIGNSQCPWEFNNWSWFSWLPSNQSSLLLLVPLLRFEDDVIGLANVIRRELVSCYPRSYYFELLPFCGFSSLIKSISISFLLHFLKMLNLHTTLSGSMACWIVDRNWRPPEGGRGATYKDLYGKACPKSIPFSGFGY